MKFPVVYSDLGPKQRAVVGFTSVFATTTIIGHLFSQRLLVFQSAFLAIINLVMIIRYLNSRYFLTWSVGNSMMPAIPLGLTVNLCKSGFTSVSEGDVVSFKMDGVTVHHRVIGKDADGNLALKGDWNDIQDPVDIHESDIQHKSVMYGNQPIYLPLSPFSILVTVLKIWKILNGEHSQMLEDSISETN